MKKQIRASRRTIRWASSQEVCEYYACLTIDSRERSGKKPENADTLPKYIQSIENWKYYPRITLLTLILSRYWYGQDLPEDHLSHYLTGRGRDQNLLSAAKKLLDLQTDKKIQEKHPACYNRRQTQEYLEKVHHFIELFHKNHVPPQSAVIAAQGKYPFSRIHLLDGNTRILAPAISCKSRNCRA